VLLPSSDLRSPRFGSSCASAPPRRPSRVSVQLTYDHHTANSPPPSTASSSSKWCLAYQSRQKRSPFW
jgi:hypothetical protein